MNKFKYGIQVTLKSTKSDGKAFRVLGGRPRVSVSYALVLSLREVDKLGWSLIAERYREITGQYVSRDTVKRRYFEGKALEKDQDDQSSEQK
ncbi:hypothetical protein ACFLVZ_02245 [Chloroflexota bacterium]